MDLGVNGRSGVCFGSRAQLPDMAEEATLHGEVILTACLDDHLVEQAFIKMTCHSNLGFLLEI